MTSGGNRQQAASSDLGPVILSAGGTGGHMFPAFALARALQARGVGVRMVTDARGAKYRDQYPDIIFHIVRAETLRAGLIAKIRMAFDLAIGTGQAMCLLRRERPRAVVGFGGYPSFPAVVAAQVLGIPTLIHEQNAVLGRANALLAGRAARIALSLPDLSSIPAAWHDKCVVTGNPVRAAFTTLAPYAPAGDAFHLLVLGGSQGATVFSKLLPDAVAQLSMRARGRLSIVQQCRAADVAGVRHAYDAMGVRARLETFVQDVPAQMEAAHLVIARSGASTVAEVQAAGRPALFVPYPHHKDQQQARNAAIPAAAGAALVMDEKTMTSQGLAKELESMMENPAKLAAMADAARKSATLEAAERLSDAVIGL